MTSAETSTIRNPAPHRGFNAKAREVLLDRQSPFGLNRTGSDDEFRRKLNGLRLMRTDSEATNTSQKSHSSTQSQPPAVEEFDDLDDLPKTIKNKGIAHKLIGEIGKTKSAGDLFKRKTVVKTFQQLNILKLPSVDSDIGEKEGMKRSESMASISDSAMKYAIN
ncbi:hypothetical protein M3Y94_00161700 [Aphelenchoides besseyi]|nr:hypothetical protein M3Y94_00161700 [Aphelenchoides besseyi]KAI6237061.1 hypothetical protein M3Y95_00225400 [Aphelenchoides besseyi]